MIRNEVYKLLDKNISDFFPRTVCLFNSCFRKSDEIDPEFFPCHVRDDDWLSLMLQEKFKLFYLTKLFIKKYIEQSEAFEKERHDYEQRIVCRQIDSMVNEGENWSGPSNLNADLFMVSPNCDLIFRRGIVDTLLAIGVSYEAIEEGLEKNTDQWREYYMNLAFCNTYGLPFDSNQINDVDFSFKTNWIRMRLYEYYQRNKASVDKYGKILPEMKMTLQEAQELRNYLDIKGQELLQSLSQLSPELTTPIIDYCDFAHSKHKGQILQRKTHKFRSKHSFL